MQLNTTTKNEKLLTRFLCFQIAQKLQEVSITKKNRLNNQFTKSFLDENFTVPCMLSLSL